MEDEEAEAVLRAVGRLLTYGTNPRRMHYSSNTSSFGAEEIGPPPKDPGYHWSAIPDN